MRARRRKRSGELATHNFHQNAYMREPELARTEPPFAPPSRSPVTFLSRPSVGFSTRITHKKDDDPIEQAKLPMVAPTSATASRCSPPRPLDRESRRPSRSAPEARD